MSHYDEVLQEARNKATHSAKEYIPKLYHILVDEEHKTAEDARKIIEHDLISYWAKATVTKFLPQEAKDEDKVKAGKKGAEATNLILAGGQTVTTEADDGNSSKNWDEELEDLGIKKDVPVKDSTEFYAEQKGETEEPTELELANIKIVQLEDALKKMQNFKPATVEQRDEHGTDETKVFEWLRMRNDGVSRFWYDGYGIDLFKSREITQLKNAGNKTFKRLYFEV